jgi:hypothetical protein
MPWLGRVCGCFVHFDAVAAAVEDELVIYLDGARMGEECLLDDVNATVNEPVREADLSGENPVGAAMNRDDHDVTSSLHLPYPVSDLGGAAV